MPNAIPRSYLTDTGVRKDWVDLRDQQYEPNLGVLPNRKELPEFLVPELRGDEAGDVPHVSLADQSDEDKRGTIPLRAPAFGVRDQGQTGRCVGYALANLIDIQRNIQLGDAAKESEKRTNIVSADMLYRMAFFHDRYPDLEERIRDMPVGVRSLRAAIKGFYHHGVCLDWPPQDEDVADTAWQSECYADVPPDPAPIFPTVDQAKHARNIALGAYYRVASILNHFHAAINDAGAILVSAKVHDGWRVANLENGGEIVHDENKGTDGTHAFVIIGYDEIGFHVLNSWGADWGGYKGQQGVALWRYADWAQNVVDAWVLRMGVFAPSAFGASIGEQGTKGLTSTIQSGTTPCLDLVGHYMHLDDGFHVSVGSYPSFTHGWETTRQYLKTQLDPENAESEYKGILIWIPGSMEGIKPAFSAAVKRKNQIKARGLYPYTIFWCNGFVEKSLEVLQTIFDSCKAQAGEDAEHLNDLIESKVQGVGRAFWRDIEASAERSVFGTREKPREEGKIDEERLKQGFLHDFLRDICELKEDFDCEVHVVAEGAGAILVHELFSLMATDNKKDGAFHGIKPHKIIDTLHLVHPAIGLPRAKLHILDVLDALNKGVGDAIQPPKEDEAPVIQPLVTPGKLAQGRLYVPTEDLERALTFGAYDGPLLRLVSRSFEDRHPEPDEEMAEEENVSIEHARELRVFRPPRPFLGFSDIYSLADAADQPKLTGAIHYLNRLRIQTRDRVRVSQQELMADPTITEDIFNAITEFRATKSD